MNEKCGNCEFREKPRKRVAYERCDFRYIPKMYCGAKKENRMRFIWKNCDLWELKK